MNDLELARADRENLDAEIALLISKAESGDDWAEICRLEAIALKIDREAETHIPDNSQFGVGA